MHFSHIDDDDDDDDDDDELDNLISIAFRRKHLRRTLKTFYDRRKDRTNLCVFNCIVNDFSDNGCLILAGKLF